MQKYTRDEFLSVLDEKIDELQDKAGKMSAEMGNANNQDVNTQMELQGQIFAHQEAAAAYSWCRNIVANGFRETEKHNAPPSLLAPSVNQRLATLETKVGTLEGWVSKLYNALASDSSEK